MTKLGLAVSLAFFMSSFACANRPAEAPATTRKPVDVGTGPSPSAEPDPPVDAKPPGRAPPPEQLGQVVCERPDEFGPVFLDAASYPNRRGAKATRFSQIPTTKEEPIEACGVRGSVEALLRLRCDDGKNPFQSPEAAHQSRAGNVGPGGRCGSIVDLYEVPCREQTYKVFIDMYICPAESAAT